ncbi:E3 UFM1-protein ligase 1 homolog [Anabrus simplex]|uniref:E3 UFM1-protein ligase 1 homolog n=1 Tax=Anabrus simplex TaxID=316456 RepID=UPI0034DD0DAF
MTAVDWDEVKRLAADFQRAQLSSTIQRLSERNCIEIVNKLIELKLLDVIFTNDGKEYITPQQLTREIRDELYVHGGRINLVELAKLLNVDLSQVSARAAEIERSDSSCTIILGQLIDKTYIKRIAQEIDEKLSQQGQITIGELTRHYDLPSDFLQTIIEKELGKSIHGRQDKTDLQVFFTDAFVARNRACVRGALSAATRPTPVSQLLSQCGVPERLFFSVIESLLEMRQVPGVVTGKQGSNSIYVPSIYSKSQNEYVNSFYRTNGYLEYDALSRLGIGDPQTFVQKHFSSEKLMLLSSCAVGSQLVEQVEAAVEEALSTASFLDVTPLLPSVFQPEDVEIIVKEVLGKCPSQNVHILCNTVVVSEQFLQSMTKLFDDVIQKKAEESVSSGAYLYAQADNKLHGNKSFDHDQPSSKADRREERRKKAATGKGGGGTQGRETKTKSTKKKYMRGKTAAEDSDEDISSAPAVGKGSKQTGRGKLELLSLQEIQDILEGQESLQEDDFTELVEEIAAHLYPCLNKAALAAAQVVFESTIASTAQTRRKTHSELQDKLNAMVTNVRMFEKGIKHFTNKETQQQLAKYLLKSICTEVTNEVFLFVAQENMIQCDHNKDLTPEVRMKIVNEAPDEARDALLKLHKSLNSTSVDDFLNCIEPAMGPGVCDMMLRKPDKKKERPQLFAHRQALLEQLSVASDPAVVLHVATLVLFQAVTQTMLHASGRFVSGIVAFLQPHVTLDVFNTLQKYHDLVLKLLTMAEDDTSRPELVRSLQEGMASIKEVATTFKKLTAAEKAQQ